MHTQVLNTPSLSLLCTCVYTCGHHNNVGENPRHNKAVVVPRTNPGRYVYMCIHVYTKQTVITTELPWVEFEPMTHCVLGARLADRIQVYKAMVNLNLVLRKRPGQ